MIDDVLKLKLQEKRPLQHDFSIEVIVVRFSMYSSLYNLNRLNKYLSLLKLLSLFVDLKIKNIYFYLKRSAAN